MSNMQEEKETFIKMCCAGIDVPEDERNWDQQLLTEFTCFQTGIITERERVIAAIKKARNPFEFSDLFRGLFPDQQEQRSG